jgi:hypothetical protein
LKKLFYILFLFSFLANAKTFPSTITFNIGKAHFVFDDKAWHYYVGGALSSSVSYGTYQFNKNGLVRISLGISIPMAIEVGKEFLHDTTPSGPDIFVTGLGVGGGVIGFEIPIDQMFRNKEERKFYKSVKPLNT